MHEFYALIDGYDGAPIGPHYAIDDEQAAEFFANFGEVLQVWNTGDMCAPGSL